MGWKGTLGMGETTKAITVKNNDNSKKNRKQKIKARENMVIVSCSVV